ncbi:MAG: acyl carrier protein [Halanaerobiales bacterium]|nr:acyl carrier protein [Halanaerobiales bacterium]
MKKEEVQVIIEGKVREVIGDPNIELTLDQKIDELGLNSIDFIKFLVFIEQEFDIEFEDEDLELGQYSTLENVIDKVASKVQ